HRHDRASTRRGAIALALVAPRRDAPARHPRDTVARVRTARRECGPRLRSEEGVAVPAAKRFAGVALALVFMTCAAVDAGKTREAAVLARVLSYELTLEERAGDAVGVAIVYKRGDAASEANADEWLRALGELSSVKIKDRRFFAE